MRRYTIGVGAVIVLSWLTAFGGKWYIGMFMLTVWIIITAYELSFTAFFD